MPQLLTAQFLGLQSLAATPKHPTAATSHPSLLFPISTKAKWCGLASPGCWLPEFRECDWGTSQDLVNSSQVFEGACPPHAKNEAQN